jgi:hypothetical protein
LREAAEQAEQSEGGQASKEDTASSEEVGGASSEHEEAGEGQRVGIDDLLLATGRHVQRSPPRSRLLGRE